MSRLDKTQSILTQWLQNLMSSPVIKKINFIEQQILSNNESKMGTNLAFMNRECTSWNYRKLAMNTAAIISNGIAFNWIYQSIESATEQNQDIQEKSNRIIRRSTSPTSSIRTPKNVPTVPFAKPKREKDLVVHHTL